MKRTIILLASIIFLSSCNYTLKLNKVTMKEYFSHIHKSGSYEVREIIGNRAVLRHYADTLDIFDRKVKAGDFISVIVLK